ncbi:hypothetical protein CKO41_12370 [Thiococcus pfennigii]|nr:hypothetical protein [Thiococcus pfennigii]MBK1732569.1 hypothetical protein [Thiococcus pfennigii]
MDGVVKVIEEGLPMSRNRSLPSRTAARAVGGAALIAGLAGPVLAHVPYFEHRDWTQERPFEVRGEVEQSIAVYSWLAYRDDEPALDVDFYHFDLAEPAEIYIEAIVPACVGYEDFIPWFALVGPGLPPPDHPLPEVVEIPEGEGAVVVPGPLPGEPREVFYEPFGGKYYFRGQVSRQEVTQPGSYQVIFWDPYEIGGDYVAVLGDEEIWERSDVLRALIYTPLIRRDRELHIDCEPVGGIEGRLRGH